MSGDRQHWEDIYAGRQPLEVSWYQKVPALSLRLIEGMGLPRDAAIIDVGGGASTLVDHLAGAGWRELAVLDISARALEVARRRLGDRARSIEWYAQDVTRFIAPHPYAVWHDRAVFHFLTRREDRRRYVETLTASLAAGGQVVIAAFAIGGPQRCSGLDIVQYDGEKLGRELGEGFELLDELPEIHTTPTGKEQRFLYFRLRQR